MTIISVAVSIIIDTLVKCISMLITATIQEENSIVIYWGKWFCDYKRKVFVWPSLKTHKCDRSLPCTDDKICILRTENGELKRPISKIAMLPFKSEV